MSDSEFKNWGGFSGKITLSDGSITNGYMWAEHTPGEWWYAQVVDGNPELRSPNEYRHGECQYPPAAYVSFAAYDDGRPIEMACWHYYKLYNGTFPHESTAEDVDYIHICGPDNLVELMQQLNDLGRAIS